jgi:REP element-mobilizing transposase RayT
MTSVRGRRNTDTRRAPFRPNLQRAMARLCIDSLNTNRVIKKTEVRLKNRSNGPAKFREGQQLSFFPPQPKFFGGALIEGKRHQMRPLAFKRAIHLVLRSRLAKGRWAFLDYRNKSKIERWLKDFAKRNGLRLYETSFNWNHIHLAVKFPSRAASNKFIRSITGTLPKVVFKFEHPTDTFWDHRPFTRIIEWGEGF